MLVWVPKTYEIVGPCSCCSIEDVRVMIVKKRKCIFITALRFNSQPPLSDSMKPYCYRNDKFPSVICSSKSCFVIFDHFQHVYFQLAVPEFRCLNGGHGHVGR